MQMFITVLILLLIIAAALAGSSFYFYRVAVARADKSFLRRHPDLAELGASAEKNGESPFTFNKEWWNRQAFVDWSLTSDDGLRLEAYYLAANRPTDKTAILAHGYSGQADQMGEFARLFKDTLGFNVLIPDARGHGRSEGKYIGFGWPERKDIVDWIGEVLKHSGKKAQIVLHGISMGGATVMMTGGEPLPPNVKAIVEDCGYTSVKEQLSYQLKRMYRMPWFPMIPATSLVTKLLAGYFFGEASALAQVKKSKTPTLFIHGDADIFVPTRMVRELYASASADKSLYIVPGAGHGLARTTDPAGYDREISLFIGHYVK
ncbi:hypothetical protein DFP95_11587 [Cohnella lupini]|uniref:Serine aminopeptidase S33 domain-containing protein n=2 Tax=Cohnella lupini TaxID=1294267 RepID=A0A3D9I2P6_9BACL|nr:hypothetical protein DFP95_11587 [Cohnella lupini]